MGIGSLPVRRDFGRVQIAFMTTKPRYLVQSMKVILFLESLMASKVHYHFITNFTGQESIEDAEGRQFTAAAQALNLTYSLHAVPLGLWPKIWALRRFYKLEISSSFMPKLFLHRILPSSVARVMVLDTDLIPLDDVTFLWRQFRAFSPTTLMGLAAEQQPTYSQCFHAHPWQRTATPFPLGFPGFNGGMQLQDLDALRRSEGYNALIDNASEAENLMWTYNKNCYRYGMRSLGDQDFLSTLANRYPEWFTVLPCSWNWQVCRIYYLGVVTWDKYDYGCPSRPKLFHGNCNFHGVLNRTGWKSWTFGIQNLTMAGKTREARKHLEKYGWPISRSSGDSEDKVWARLELLQGRVSSSWPP